MKENNDALREEVARHKRGREEHLYKLRTNPKYKLANDKARKRYTRKLSEDPNYTLAEEGYQQFKWGVIIVCALFFAAFIYFRVL